MIRANFSPVGAALRFDPCEVNKFGYRNMSRRPWRAISEIGDEQACLQSYDHRKVWNQSPPCLCHMKEDSLSLMPGNSQGIDGHPSDLEHHQNHLGSCEDRHVAFL